MYVITLQCGDTLVRLHEMRHDVIQRSLPLAGGTRTRTGVRPGINAQFRNTQLQPLKHNTRHSQRQF